MRHTDLPSADPIDGGDVATIDPAGALDGAETLDALRERLAELEIWQKAGSSDPDSTAAAIAIVRDKIARLEGKATAAGGAAATLAVARESLKRADRERREDDRLEGLERGQRYVRLLCFGTPECADQLASVCEEWGISGEQMEADFEIVQQAVRMERELVEKETMKAAWQRELSAARATRKSLEEQLKQQNKLIGKLERRGLQTAMHGTKLTALARQRPFLFDPSTGKLWPTS